MFDNSFTFSIRLIDLISWYKFGVMISILLAIDLGHFGLLYGIKRFFNKICFTQLQL